MPKRSKIKSQKKQPKQRSSYISWLRFLSWRRVKWFLGITGGISLFFAAQQLSLITTIQDFFIQEGFVPKHIYVVGRNELARETLINILKPYQQQPIFYLDEADLAAKIQALDWIENVDIKCYLPNTLIIKIEEGKPIALWQHNKKHHLIDQKGRVIKTQYTAKFGYLPVLVGKTAPEHAFSFFESVAAHPDLKEKISAAIHMGDRRWDIHMKNGIIIKMPENSLTVAWDRLAALNEEHKILHRSIKIIDLRLPDRLILEMKEPGPYTNPKN